MVVPLVKLPETISVSRETDTLIVKRKPAALGVNPNKESIPPPPPNSDDSTEVMEASLKSALHEKAEVIDLVAQVNDDDDKELMTMDLSGENLATDELSRDSEGCRTHKNEDGIEVPDTPSRGSHVIVVEDDLDPDPGITLGTPDEESVADRELSAARIGPSSPVTLAAPVSQPVTVAGGGGLSVPVIPPASVVK